MEVHHPLAISGRISVMIFRLFIFLIGFGLAIAGGVSVIAFLNILAAGLNIIDYFLFISKKIECYLLIIGIILISISIYCPLDSKHK